MTRKLQPFSFAMGYINKQIKNLEIIKRTIITLAIASFIILSNINCVSAKENTRCTITTENNIKTIISFSGNKNEYAKGDIKTVNKYDENKNLTERILYSWDRGEWMPVSKHEWFYTKTNILNKVSYEKWNSQSKKWNDTITESQYFYNDQNNVVSVNQEMNK